MYKTCSVCGKIHDINFQCHKKQVKQAERTEQRTLRSSRKWTDKSKDIRDRSHYLCAVCFDQGIINYQGTEVHHIIKVKESPDSLLDDSNLITLCKYHHKKADRGGIPKDYLFSLAKKRDIP